jgi:hypothetical protein
MGDFVWPVVDDAESAPAAAHFAAVWAIVLACLNLIVGMLLFHWSVVLGFAGVTYGLAAWRIWEGSYPWAIAAFVLCILQTALVLINLPVLWAVLMPFALSHS